MLKKPYKKPRFVYVIKMNSKLTLRISSSSVHRAKRFARKKKTSISKLVETYLDSLNVEEKKEIKITPLVKKLSGVIKLPSDFDFKKAYGEHLRKKYR